MLVFDGITYWTGWKHIWADWTIHIPYTLNIAHRPFPLLTHPQLSGAPFRYHFAADLISGLMMKTGISLIPALIIPSILAMWATILALLVWYRIVWKDTRTAWVAMMLFLANGGLGFVWVTLTRLHLIPSLHASHDLVKYTKLDQYGIVWENFITAELIPQRPFLLGLPITICLMIFVYRYTVGQVTPSRKMLILAGTAAGVLPLIHIYSFTVLVGYAAYLILLYSRKKLLQWFWFFFPLIIAASGIVFGIFRGFGSGGLRIALGWLAPPGFFEFIWFWFNNLGIMAILIPIGWFYSERRIKIVTLPLMLLFVIANIVVFQEVTWDNRKYFLYWYLAACGYTAHWVVSLFRSGQVAKQILVTVVVYVAVLSGLLDVIALFRFESQKYPLFSHEIYAVGATLRHYIPHDAVVLTNPTNTYLGMVLGRQTVLGFVPWLENHGFDAAQRERESIDIYQGSANAKELIKKYAIDYIVVGDAERRHMTHDWFKTEFPVLLSQGDTTVYAIPK